MKKLSPEDLAAYRKNGYHIERGVFTREEMKELAQGFDDFAAAGKSVPGTWELPPDAETSSDPLARYPRVMHPHRILDISRKAYLDQRIKSLLESILDDEPIAIQSMFYWKPPGARGQAFHQDNLYARVKPASCIAGWVAVDPATPENGGLYIVPGTQNMEIKCPEIGDTTNSFIPEHVPIPEGLTPIPATMEPGDVLFFEGNILHGSNPNTSKTTWRRSHVCHYMPRSASHLSSWFMPVLDFDGNEVNTFEANGDMGPCGGKEGTQEMALV